MIEVWGREGNTWKWKEREGVRTKMEKKGESEDLEGGRGGNEDWDGRGEGERTWMKGGKERGLGWKGGRS